MRGAAERGREHRERRSAAARPPGSRLHIRPDDCNPTLREWWTELRPQGEFPYPIQLKFGAIGVVVGLALILIAAVVAGRRWDVDPPSPNAGIGRRPCVRTPSW